MEDVDVPAFWQSLGLPGLFDVHTHFLPPRVQAKVWEQFDAGGPLIGRPWHIRYRGTDQERVEQLRALGVRHFSALAYAHRPGMAEFLNDWAFALADEVPECLRSATFFPEEGAEAYVEKRLAGGTDVFKVHVQVGAFDLREPLLDPVWGLLAEAGTPVVIHAGSGPVGTEFTGPDPLRGVLERHPRLTAVVAHMGSPEYHAFFAMVDDFPRVHLDTTMVFTRFFDERAPYPADLVPRLLDRADRVLLGSDFPNIPYPYGHQLEGLVGLGLGDDWLRRVCWHNGVELFAAATVPG